MTSLRLISAMVAVTNLTEGTLSSYEIGEGAIEGKIGAETA
jgi:hypothetical protein